MHDTQALQAPRQGRQQELAQSHARLGEPHTVQIDLGFDAVIAAAQAAQHRFGHPGLAKLQRVAGLNVKVRGRRSQTLAQHRSAIGAGVAGASLGLATRGAGALRYGKRAYPAHGFAENVAFVVLAGQVTFLRKRALSILARPLSRSPTLDTMKILVSNDDGYRSEGIARLRTALSSVGSVTVVAPDRNRSGASNSLTLDVPLRVTQSEPGVHFVTGTPTDCVHLAVSGLFDFDFDLAVSGVNDGPNLGDDVLYSGTVAAAIEGRFLGLPTLAVSLCTVPGGERHFETGAIVAQRIVTQLIGRPLDPRLILNINVPDVPLAQLRGMRATRLGFRHRSEPAVPVRNPKGETMYWVGPAGAGADAGEGTDFQAVAEGWVSVTPLSIDLTRHSALPELRQWLESVPLRDAVKETQT
jgi:5'-nucleotidase